VTIQHGQKRIISDLFEAFSTAIKTEHLEYFPIGFAQLIETDSSNIPPARWTADYLSGLTERQILTLYRRIVGNH
jgi:dGTP triphosphohydrolase